MKKLSIILAFAALAAGFTSCEEDRDPVYQAPTEFILNVPQMQDQYIELNDAKSSVLEFTCSQPDYGYSAVTQYSMQMAIDEAFTTTYDLESVSATSAQIQVKQADVALGLLELQGIADEEAYAAAYGNGQTAKIYFRAVAQLTGVESSLITSNVVTYNNLRPYFAVPVPGFIYLVGAPEGWAGPTESNAAHYAEWKLSEPANGIGSKIYTGVFDIPAGSAMFRFYTQLTGWDADSYGAQVDDNPLDFEFVDGSFSSAMVKGKGSFNFPNWAGGTMTIVVNMSDMNNILVDMYEGNHEVTVAKYIYLVGGISGWMAPGTENAEAYKAYRLADTADSGIYTGTFTAPAGHCNFRFALELTDEGWDNPTQIGAQADDADVACEFSNNVYSGGYTSGKGNWAFELAAESTIQMTVDTNTQTVSFTLL